MGRRRVTHSEFVGRGGADAGPTCFPECPPGRGNSGKALPKDPPSALPPSLPRPEKANSACLSHGWGWGGAGGKAASAQSAAAAAGRAGRVVGDHGGERAGAGACARSAGSGPRARRDRSDPVGEAGHHAGGAAGAARGPGAEARQPGRLGEPHPERPRCVESQPRHHEQHASAASGQGGARGLACRCGPAACRAPRRPGAAAGG